MSFVTVVLLLRMSKKTKILYLKSTSMQRALCRHPDMRVEFNVPSKLLWDKANKGWSKEPQCPTKLLQEHRLPATPTDVQDRHLQNQHFLHRIIYLSVISVKTTTCQYCRITKYLKLERTHNNHHRSPTPVWTGTAISFWTMVRITMHTSFPLPCSKHYLRLCDERRCLQYWGFWEAGETLHTALRSASWLQPPRFWNETRTTLPL